MKARLLQDQAVSVFCKHGLHRSAAGARKVGEELASEGYLVWVFNIGCSERWWAKQYKLVELVPAAVESGASYEQVAQRVSIIIAESRSINSPLVSPVVAKHSSQFDPSHTPPPVIHRCQPEVAAASHRPGTPPEAAVGTAEAGSPAPPSPPPAGEPDHALASRSPSDAAHMEIIVAPAMLGGPLLPHRPLQSRIHAVLPHRHTHSGWLSFDITSTLVHHQQAQDNTALTSRCTSNPCRKL